MPMVSMAMRPAASHLIGAVRKGRKRPGNKDIQLSLLMDYKTNVPIYPQFQEYFRKSQVPVLAAWGKGDIIFIPPGAEAFKRDFPKAEVHLLDAGHFAVESHTEDIADLMLRFLEKNDI
jgi:pimeloyl-ACP methyl ester carboxylesterase